MNIFQNCIYSILKLVDVDPVSQCNAWIQHVGVLFCILTTQKHCCFFQYICLHSAFLSRTWTELIWIHLLHLWCCLTRFIIAPGCSENDTGGSLHCGCTVVVQVGIKAKRFERYCDVQILKKQKLISSGVHFRNSSYPINRRTITVCCIKTLVYI